MWLDRSDGRWWRRRRRHDTHQGIAAVERVGLVPKVAPYEMEAPSHAVEHGGVDRAQETAQAGPAVAGGHVRHALRHGVHRGGVGAAVHDARGEPRRRLLGRTFHGLGQQLADEAGDEGHVTAGDVVPAPHLVGRVI